uniref:Uncharacterized protein n=1 Tax=Anguilla anguilla TaxID=7936 RepID=A0A0E9W595_ANGAN
MPFLLCFCEKHSKVLCKFLFCQPLWCVHFFVDFLFSFFFKL